MSWWTPNRQAYAVSALVNGGLSPYGAAGLVSRWANVEAPNGPASRGGYLGRAWGIAQWLGARLTPIDGNPDFDAQLSYVLQELDGSESRAGSLLRSASDAQTAAQGATAYERASGWNPSTNTDNFTSRTAAGVPAVLNNWQGVQAVNNSPDTAYSTLLNLNPLTTTTASAAVAGGIGLGTVALIGGGLLLVWWLMD